LWRSWLQSAPTQGPQESRGKTPAVRGDRRPVESPRRVHRDHHRPTVFHG
jgi:hypothetical protein